MEQPTTILTIPIFPLNVVLFPGMPLPLHIFEERYKAMIARCLEGNRTFGVALVSPGVTPHNREVPYTVGTVARIVRHIRMDDGRYNLVTRGTSRFQILESQYELEYLTAQVELLSEEEQDSRGLEILRANVEEQFEGMLDDLATVTNTQREPLAFPDDPTAASYLVAHYLPIYPWEKQRLLEAFSTDMRLLEEQRLLRRERGMFREFGAAPAIYQVQGAAALLQDN